MTEATMNLEQVFDCELLERMLQEGFVKLQRHPTLPLAIYNYTAQAQYTRTWNEVTRACRGLIVENDRERVVARPFEKFFNWSEPEMGALPVGSSVVAPKMDGSLGILYTPDWNNVDTWGIATRGSFTSPQSARGTEIFKTIFREYEFVPEPHLTYLFEIIYPENRIVCNYGDAERLTLLEVIDNATGAADLCEFDACEWPDKVKRTNIQIMDKNGDQIHTLLDDVPEDEEGLVFYFPGPNKRMKMKKAEYVRLHRIVTGVSTKTIWYTLANRGDFHELLDRVPDEFYTWVKERIADFNTLYEDDYNFIQKLYAKIVREMPEGYTRKDFATYVMKNHKKHSGLLFQLLDGKDIRDSIWAGLRPTYEKPFALQSEDNS